MNQDMKWGNHGIAMGEIVSTSETACRQFKITQKNDHLGSEWVPTKRQSGSFPCCRRAWKESLCLSPSSGPFRLHFAQIIISDHPPISMPESDPTLRTCRLFSCYRVEKSTFFKHMLISLNHQSNIKPHRPMSHHKTHIKPT